jgi:hypothetical protein
VVGETDAPSVDDELADWRQGDCVVGEYWFAHRFDPRLPVTEAARTAAGADDDLVEEKVAGLVVVTQTCDIVRNCAARPFVEVCPLVEVDADKLREIESGRRPAYGFVPSLAPQRLVAHLDRTMTVVKPVVAKWPRTPGCSTDPQARAFANALARKRARFPFPTDFTQLARKLQSRLVEKHGKRSAEGDALRKLREIRVLAVPSWDAQSVALTFLFIRHSADAAPGDFLGKWLNLVQPSGRFTRVEGHPTTLEDMTAADYVNSDPLDLDHLSSSSEAG